jgi:glycerol kinase
MVIHQDGSILGHGRRELAQHFPRPGWVEHDPEELISSILEAARAALAAAGERPAGIGITNQRETIVLWERKSLLPVAPAIVWQDRRTADRCRELREAGSEPLIRGRTGLLLDPYFSASKLEWLLQNPDLRLRAERGELAAGTVDSWLIARLTGGRAHVTDPTNASRTMLYGLASGEWDRTLTDLFQVPDSLLPALTGSSGVCGETEPGLLGYSLPIGALRSGLRYAGRREEHLWDRGFSSAVHRRDASPATRGIAGNRGL